MKKFLPVLFAAFMLAALTACGSPGAAGGSPSDSGGPVEPADSQEPGAPRPSGPSPSPSEAEPESAPADDGDSDSPAQPPSKEPSVPPQKPSVPPSAEPSVPPQESSVPSQKPSVPPQEPSVPPQEPSAGPSEPPAGPSEEPSAPPSGAVDLQAFHESLFDKYENFNASMSLEGEFLDAYYAGLSEIALKQQAIYMPMISAVVCEIAVVEVENAGDVDAVKAAFQARIDYQVGTDDAPGGAWYPASIEGWKNNSRIVSSGNYVLMIASEYCDEIVSDFNALF